MENLKKRNPFVAFFLSLLIPGLGNLYNGQIRKAVLFLGIFLLFDAVTLLLIGIIPSILLAIIFFLEFVYYISVAFDASFSARKVKEIKLQPYNKWYIYLFIIIVMSLIGTIENSYLYKVRNIENRFPYKPYNTPGGSMRPMLIEHDHLIVNMHWFNSHYPHRGDLVVFRAPQNALSPYEKAKKVKKDFNKRCVAVSGDTVEIMNKVLFVNKQKIDEHCIQYSDRAIYYAAPLFSTSEQYQKSWEDGNFVNIPPNIIRDNFGPVRVPANCIFVLGDNRDRSFDSRFYGPVNNNLLKGKPLFIYFAKDIKRIGRKL